MIVNDYIMTVETAQALAKEYVKTWNKKHNGKKNIVMNFCGVMLILGVIQGAIQGTLMDDPVSSGVIIAGALIYLLVRIRYMIQLIQTMKKVGEVIGDKKIGIHVEMDETIKIIGDKNTTEIPYEAITDYLNTPNYLALMQGNENTIILKKDSFVDTDYLTFKEFYEKKKGVLIK